MLRPVPMRPAARWASIDRRRCSPVAGHTHQRHTHRRVRHWTRPLATHLGIAAGSVVRRQTPACLPQMPTNYQPKPRPSASVDLVDLTGVPSDLPGTPVSPLARGRGGRVQCVCGDGGSYRLASLVALEYRPGFGPPIRATYSPVSSASAGCSSRRSLRPAITSGPLGCV